jgi:hypothetical protein
VLCTAVFWQQPNAAKTMCYQVLPRAEVGCVLAATKCGQSDVLSGIAAPEVGCFGSNRMRPKHVLSGLAARRSGLCFGSNQMRPKRCVIRYCRAEAVFWQQPNAAKAMCYQVLRAAEVGCVLAATECGQNDVLSGLAARRYGLCFGSNRMRQSDVLSSGLCFGSNRNAAKATEMRHKSVFVFGSNQMQLGSGLCFGRNRLLQCVVFGSNWMLPEPCIISDCCAQFVVFV